MKKKEENLLSNQLPSCWVFNRGAHPPPSSFRWPLTLRLVKVCPFFIRRSCCHVSMPWLKLIEFICLCVKLSVAYCWFHPQVWGVGRRWLGALLDLPVWPGAVLLLSSPSFRSSMGRWSKHGKIAVCRAERSALIRCSVFWQEEDTSPRVANEEG